MASLDEVRRYVAEHISLDDLPDEMVDEWIRHGYRRVQSETTWPWHRSDTIVTVAMSGELSNFTTLPGVRQVLAVTDSETGRLDEISLPAAWGRWRPDTTYGPRPTHYTVVSGGESLTANQVQLRLWPRAALDRDNVLVTSLLAVEEWPSLTTQGHHQVPLPPAFHELLGYWALNEAYMRENNLDLAQPQYSAFMSALARLRSQYVSVGPTGIRLGAGDGQPLQDVFG